MALRCFWWHAVLVRLKTQSNSELGLSMWEDPEDELDLPVVLPIEAGGYNRTQFGHVLCIRSLVVNELRQVRTQSDTISRKGKHHEGDSWVLLSTNLKENPNATEMESLLVAISSHHSGEATERQP